jgi:hypothetical protein
MISLLGHGSDAVVITENEKARWAATHRAEFVNLSADRLAVLLTAATSLPATPRERCKDGIGIVPRRP